MPLLMFEGRTVEVSEEGFLTDGAEWTPELAEHLARETGTGPLHERHWKVLTLCREDAARHGQSPGLYRIARLSGLRLEELHRLFPGDPAELAARIAGLPRPGDVLGASDQTSNHSLNSRPSTREAHS